MGSSCILESVANILVRHMVFVGNIQKSKKISNDQEPIQLDPTSCPQNQKGNN